MPNIITKCFYILYRIFCACWILLNLKWALVWFRFASEKGKHQPLVITKNVDSVFFSVHLVRNVCLNMRKKNSVHSFHASGIFVWLARNCRHSSMNECQYLYLYDTWQCKTLECFGNVCGIRKKMHIFSPSSCLGLFYDCSFFALSLFLSLLLSLTMLSIAIAMAK